MPKPSTPSPSSSAPRCCEQVGSVMVGHFATRLEVEAQKAGGSLTAAQIRVLAQRFVESEQARFHGFYQRSYDECTKVRAMLQMESSRSKPFDRILMRRFAPLFPPRSGDDGGVGVLSRRIIPGFNLAIHKMIGPTLYQQCQDKCEAVLARHPLPGGGWAWDRIHADPDARLLVNEVLVVVAHYFQSFDKRRSWFVEMINGHLAPVAHGARDEHFLFGESAFSALMRALFAELEAQIRSDPRAIRSRWGDQTVTALEAFFQRLDRA